MSLMGVVMMVGIVVSNSILIVEFARHLHHEGKPLKEAVSVASRLRLRPVLMTSLATIFGLIPMALGIEAGSEQYAPLARAIIGGLLVSVVVTVYLVPAAYLIVHRKSETRKELKADNASLATAFCSSPFLRQTPENAPTTANTPGNRQSADFGAGGRAALKNNPQITIGRLRALEA